MPTVLPNWSIATLGNEVLHAGWVEAVAARGSARSLNQIETAPEPPRAFHDALGPVVHATEALLVQELLARLLAQNLSICPPMSAEADSSFLQPQFHASVHFVSMAPWNGSFI